MDEDNEFLKLLGQAFIDTPKLTGRMPKQIVPADIATECYDWWQQKFEDNIKLFQYEGTNEGRGVRYNLDRLRKDWGNVTGIIGIDLPLLISPSKGADVVMVIGQDPLRNKENAKSARVREKRDHYAIIGTPYALHNKGMREGKTKEYRKIVQTVLRLGYAVYLTDVRKIWPPQQDEKVGKRNTDILLEEIKTITPTLIVSFGREARSILATFGSDTHRFFTTQISKLDLRPVESAETPPKIEGAFYLPLLHPSGNAARYRCSWLKTNGCVESHSKLLEQLITHYLRSK